MHAIESRQIEKLLSCYLAEANLDGSRIYQGSIGQTEGFLMDRESVKDLSAKQKVSRWIENLSRSYRDKV